VKRVFTARESAVIGLFVALTAVLSQIAIPVPFTPAPISFGLVAVYITGMLLRPGHAVLAQVCYLLLGAAGAPVFGNFRGGIGALFGPTGGYLMVYPVVAGIVAVALNSRRDGTLKRPFLRAALSIPLAHAVLYLGGTAWLSFTSGNSFRAALALAVYPFIPLDVLKIAFCVLAGIPLRSRVTRLYPVFKTTKKEGA